MIRVDGWQTARQEQQLIEWFGHVPDFLITLAADYCAQCSDAEFCAPKFTKDGMPRLALRGHDVEKFIGAVMRAIPDAVNPAQKIA
ncbi:putative metallopeptidase [Castellaniella hirudinis]|uniref:putative metallopeptidase n=1 Tax=Castellaniella hirudinis TaxID=1144617 RepID=UPI0039C2663F